MSSRYMMMRWVFVLAVGGSAADPALAGDVDGDGVNDAVDLCQNTPAGVAVDAQGRPLADLDDDCDADLNDYTLLQQGFTGPLPPAPEPLGMVLVPAGEYQMGCHAETGETCASHALPVHAVYTNAFWMDHYEVNNQQYADALNWAWGQGDLIAVTGGIVYKAGGGTSYPYCDTTTSSAYSRITWNGSTFGVVSGKENHPMVMVSWYGSVAYANWRSTMQARPLCYDLTTWQCNFSVNGYRLPTEAEWEKAARGGLHSPYYQYPWGNTVDGSMANYSVSGDPYQTGAYPWTTPVGYYDGGQYPSGVDMANGYGLYDVAGNVWEWCNDWYSTTYYSSSPYDNPHGPTSGSFHGLRGGSWAYDTTYLRCANRDVYGTPFNGSHNYGFRLALDSD